MPELPEVETTRRGIAPHLLGRRVLDVVVREPRLRWPVTAALAEGLCGQTVTAVTRRGKYLLLGNDRGHALLHLGMSGSLRILPADAPVGRHDHLDLVLEGGRCLRLTDPRRFGAALWAGPAPFEHPLLRALGPEPFDARFDAAYLRTQAQGRRAAVKTFIMDSHVVVGVGNIYASEALFLAGIHPQRAAGRVSHERYGALVEAIREVLTQAIEAGGTTLRDFVGSEGRPGYFRQSLRVYERAGAPCRRCGTPLRAVRLGQRSSYYCPHCQR
ncbi:DNA-(apurinic or apyrimidinic site) lyase [Plasticicumulans lactativorans]|uniref:Formamidopyrimidine-DNA glycosylase n=1 Tax=Plasticicumulans lactativorans TaxID=1133106 RepID=A0A4R2L4B2_9GAMM|nr:bifunctional DNA-formamidopyrimidine glycosylase/DNA-(apurinic or apyrimidinic site) lyase [Plasticicumulans lactativorans]TCO81424.1 DNA-(apurinic or apyrimidinic site) lyase [Plasticicumulans lactativorans]